jgi:hypothetical protein
MCAIIANCVSIVCNSAYQTACPWQSVRNNVTCLKDEVEHVSSLLLGVEHASCLLLGVPDDVARSKASVAPKGVKWHPKTGPSLNCSFTVVDSSFAVDDNTLACSDCLEPNERVKTMSALCAGLARLL